MSFQSKEYFQNKYQDEIAQVNSYKDSIELSGGRVSSIIKKMEKVEIESDDKLFSLGVFAKHDSFLSFEHE